MNDKKYTALNFSLWILLFLLVTNTAARAESPISYTIRPIPAADRTNLQIAVRFQAADQNPVKVNLPTDCFGLPQISRFITEFKGANQTVVQESEKTGERLVKPAPDNSVAIDYTISYNPKEVNDYPYAPNVSADYFHVAGCQFLLHVGDDEAVRQFEFQVKDAPADWHIYSSHSPDSRNFKVDSSYEELASGTLGGGRNFYEFKVKNKPVAVYLHGDYTIPSKEIYSAVERIVRFQRDWFKDYSQPFYQIVIAPRNGVVAGYAPSNSFVCFVKPDITELELNTLLSHELFHHWLGNKIQIEPSPGSSFVRYEWLTEGVTDYFAQRILLEAKLITKEQFADAVNKFILNVADNPNRAKTLEELSNAAKNNAYGSAHKKLSYHRGALIALNWEAELRARRSKTDLADFIRALYKKANAANGKISESVLFDLAKKFGFDLENDLNRYIVRGEPIKLFPNALGDEYVLREKLVPSFDLGFDLQKTSASKKISGVIANSAAEKAGLHDGMEYVGIANSNRFANAWRLGKPTIVTVKVDGAEKRFEYLPRGNAMKLELFEKR